MATDWLSESEQHSWRNFIMTVHDLMAALETDLAPHGLTMGDYEVLVWLSEAEQNRMRMCDLAGALQLSPSGLTRRLDGMVKNGWVERRADSEDRRINRLYLTADARRAHKDMWAIAEATVDDALAPLSVAEREQFTRLAERVKGQLQSMAGAHGT